MHEILFRGKRLDNREWVEGFLYVTHAGEYEIGSYHAETNIERWTSVVSPSTVGQYTGLKDKAGKRIFEGDVLRWTGQDGESGKVAVMFAGAAFCLQSVECPRSAPDLFEDFEIGDQTLEVIGNVTDNPDLLEGGAANA